MSKPKPFEEISAFTGYNPQLVERSKVLRKAMTPQERHLWYNFLRDYPVKFYRQRPIGWYIADFYCSQAKVAIELDGSQHFTPEGHSYDEARTEIINQYGITVLRFSNDAVDQHFYEVCSEIDRTIQKTMNR